MQNKLQELTDKLYNEGLSKGKKEAEDLKAAAVKESDRIIADARKEAEKIVADARKDPELIRSLLTTVVGAFNAADAAPAGLEAVLPASMQESLQAWFGKNATEAMNKGIDVTFSKQIQGGFRIGPKDGGYMISFAEGDFENILTEYLRPTARKLLFGQE